jgi:hypothetical protein
LSVNCIWLCSIHGNARLLKIDLNVKHGAIMNPLPDEDHVSTRKVWLGCLAVVLIGAGILLIVASSTAPGASIARSPFTV